MGRSSASDSDVGLDCVHWYVSSSSFPKIASALAHQTPIQYPGDDALRVLTGAQ